MGGWIGAVVIYVTLALAGAAVGVVGAFVQANSADLGSLSMPYGIVIAIAAAVALFWLARFVVRRPRAGVIVAAAGWLAGVLPLSTGRPEGDVVLPSGDLRSYLYLFLPMLAAAVIATLAPAARKADRVLAPGKVGMRDVEHGDTRQLS